LYQLLGYIPRRQQSTGVTYLLNSTGTMARKTHFICTRKLHIFKFKICKSVHHRTI